MRIVIVSANFDDQSRIGSARPRSFATWLARFGHDVTVVTQQLDATVDREPMSGVEIVRIARLGPLKRIHAIAKRFYLRLKSRGVAVAPAESRAPESSGLPPARAVALASASLGFRAIDDYLWAKSAARQLRGSPVPDIVFSTFGPLSSLWLGQRLAELWSNAVWVADFRDLVTGDTYPAAVDRRLRRVQRDVVSRARAVTTISKGLGESLIEGLSPELAAKVHVLPNGFEPSTRTELTGRVSTDRTLRIGYTGNMYAGRRDATALFQVLRELIDSGAIDARSVEVHYAGNDEQIFLAQAAKHAVHDVVVNHGRLDKQGALDLQARSDMLLVLSWNTRAQRGVLTGKVFEYMSSGRPVLALTGGDLARAELTQLIDDLNLGFAFEYVTGEHGLHSLKEYLLDAYQRRQLHEDLSVGSAGDVRAYEYERIARRLEALFVLCRERAVPAWP